MYCYFAKLGIEDLFMQLRIFFFLLWKKTQGLLSMCPFFLLTHAEPVQSTVFSWLIMA